MHILKIKPGYAVNATCPSAVHEEKSHPGQAISAITEEQALLDHQSPEQQQANHKQEIPTEGLRLGKVGLCSLLVMNTVQIHQYLSSS